MTVAREYRWMSFDDIVSDAAERIKDITNHEINPNTLAEWAGQACREFARRTNVIKGTELRPMVLGQQYYRLPIDLLLVNEVVVTIPGYTGDLTLPYLREDELQDGTSDVAGTPFGWFLSPDRKQLGLVNIPSQGGYEGVTTSNGNVGGTTLIATGLSSTNDIYNNLLVRILDGTLVGQERTISDYVASTKTVTVSVAFSGQVLSGVQFEIHPDSLRIEYIRAGNSYHTRPTSFAIQAAPVPTYNVFDLNTPTRPIDYWIGKEIRFTSGTLIRERSRIIDSTSDGTVTVFPPFFAKPVAADTIVITDVPNIPDEFHPALVDYLVHLALIRNGTPDPQHIAGFLEKVSQARERDLPVQGLEFEQIREFGRGEFEVWD